MDEQRLGELFRTAADDAARGAPPPAFGHDDVVAGSRRLARRRRMLVGGAVGVLAAVVLVGAGAAVVRLQSEETSALAQYPAYAAPSASAGAPDGAEAKSAPGPAARDAAPPQAAPPQAAAPQAAAPQAAAPAPATVAGGPGCAEPDVRVFAHLATALPGARSTRPYAVPGGCATGGVGVAMDVVDNSVVGGARGTLYVVLVPAGADLGTPADDLGTASAVAHARSGGMLRVTAMSSGGQTPYRQQLSHLAAQLAARL